MRIRRYRESDHDEVWALHNLALEGTDAHPGNGPWDDDLHHVRDIYLNSGGEFLVGVHDQKVVAMGALKRTSTDRAEVKRMRVHPDFQHRGFGRAILQRLEPRATGLGYTSLHLDTTVQQIPAQQLYVQNGYSEVGRSKLGRFDVIHYEKTLQSA